MNKTTNSFFIGDTPKGSFAALPDKAGGRELSGRILQQIAIANESFEQATRRLLRLCELAHGARDYVALDAISQALASIPFAPAQNAATYYAAIIAKRDGDFDRAVDLLAPLDAPRAVQTLATIHEAKGHHADAARLYVEALRTARAVDPLTVINATIQLSAIKSSAGDHHAALADLQAIAPLVRTFSRLHPHLFYQLHNELAVELAAVGQIDEARAAVAVAIASPIAEAYPEWRETAREVAPARVMVVVKIEQEAGEPTETRTLMFRFHNDDSSHRYHQIVTIHTRTLNPRAGPRAPPSWS